MIFGPMAGGTALFASIVLSILLDASSHEAAKKRFEKDFPGCTVEVSGTWSQRAFSVDCPMPEASPVNTTEQAQL